MRILARRSDEEPSAVCVDVDTICPFLAEKSVIETEWEKTKKQREMKDIIYGGGRVLLNNEKMISEMCKDPETATRLVECLVKSIEDKGE